MVIYMILAVILITAIVFLLKKKKGNKMPQGLQIWDANGKKIFDSTVNTTYILGSGETGTSNGSITVPELSKGKPWVLVVNFTTSSSTNGSYPFIRIENDTIRWTFNSRGSNKLSCSFIYGWY